jgi:hypothetical protein
MKIQKGIGTQLLDVSTESERLRFRNEAIWEVVFYKPLQDHKVLDSTTNSSDGQGYYEKAMLCMEGCDKNIQKPIRNTIFAACVEF